MGEIEDIEDIIFIHDNKKYYLDKSGFRVMTSYFLLQSGKCCGNKCRHCPYGHINVKNHECNIEECHHSMDAYKKYKPIDHHDSRTMSGEKIDLHDSVFEATNNLNIILKK